MGFDINLPTLGLIAGSAIIGAINPCSIGGLVLMVSVILASKKSKQKLLVLGGVYIFTIFTTQLLIGLGLLSFLSFLPWVITKYISVTMGTVIVLLGLVEIKDYFWYGKGFSLAMIPGAAQRIKKYTIWIEGLEGRHPAVLYGVTAALGVFVVLVELPCTGAPYLVILGLLAKGAYASAIPLLLLYNFVFVLPLLVILAFAYFGTSSEQLEAWRHRNREWMRLAVGIFLLCLGFYMIYSLNPIF